MREILLRFFFQGHATAAELAGSLVGTVSREGSAGGPFLSRFHIEDMAVDFQVEPEHIIRLIDAVTEGSLSLSDLDTIGFCLEASDRFLWDTDAIEGERVSEAVFWLSTPEINYPLTPTVLAKVRRYLLTGENTLTVADTRPWLAAKRASHTPGFARRREPTPHARHRPARANSGRGLTFAAVDIQLLMLWCPLLACAPVGAPRTLWSDAECD